MLIFSMYKGSDSLSRMFDLLPGTLGSAVPLFPGSSWIFPGAKRVRSFFLRVLNCKAFQLHQLIRHGVASKSAVFKRSVCTLAAR